MEQATEEDENEGASEVEEPVEDEAPEPVHAKDRDAKPLKGVAAPASTMLTDGVYDEIRRLRSRVSDS